MPPDSRTWLLTKATVADLGSIWSHTAQNWSVAQADRYHNDIMGMIADLAANRKHGRKIEIDSKNYLCHPCGSHNIFFRREKSRIVVVRILHQRMDFKRHL